MASLSCVRSSCQRAGFGGGGGEKFRLFIAGAAALGWGHVQAQSLNIDFGSVTPTPSSSFGAAAGQEGFWNQVAVTGPSALRDLGDQSTGVSLDLTAGSVNGVQVRPDSDLVRLVGDNFFSFNESPWSVRLSGLASGTYDLYFYANINLLVPTGSFTVNGTSIPSFGTASGTSLVLGTDHQVLRGVGISDGLLVLDSASPVGGLSGMQLVMAPVPEPATVALFAAGLGALVFMRLRHRRAG